MPNEERTEQADFHDASHALLHELRGRALRQEVHAPIHKGLRAGRNVFAAMALGACMHQEY